MKRMNQNSKFLGLLSIAVFATATQTACNGPQKAATVGIAIGVLAKNIYDRNRETVRQQDTADQNRTAYPAPSAPTYPNNQIYIGPDGKRYVVVGECKITEKTRENEAVYASGKIVKQTYAYKALEGCPPGTQNNGGRATVADLAPEEVALGFKIPLTAATRVVEALAAVEENPASAETVLKQLGLSESDIANIVNSRMPSENGIASVSGTLDAGIENTRDLVQTFVMAFATAQATQGAELIN